jgi:lipopolysaccharide/colanic/teichoic acid biosynthesis glycosyltransferase
MKKGFVAFLIDSVILVASFYFLIYLKYNSVKIISSVEKLTAYFLILWIIVSLLTGKYTIGKFKTYRETVLNIAFSNLLILGLSVILIRISRPFIEFRFLILYSIFLATILELIVGYFFTLVDKALQMPYSPERTNGALKAAERRPRENIPEPEIEEEILAGYESLIDLNSIIIEETDQDTLDFIKKYFSTRKVDTLITSTTTVFNIYNQPRAKYKVIINLKRINDFQYINKFFEAVNSKLNLDGIYIDWVETYSQRKKRILKKFPVGINYIIYTCDFIFRRVFPKLDLTKKLYFFLTRGQNRVISKAETFGRLYSCGFEIVEEEFINNRLFFVFRKIKEPLFDYHPTYGPIIKLKRIGKHGATIGVFKLRTMHAYSEYLQGYIYDKYNLEEGGKFKNDFRITTLGRIFRALWIDELPMLINVLFQRNMKIVGVRPLSQHYFGLYSEELQKKRIRFKPGLIPPYYAQHPTPLTLEEIQANEMQYLEEYEKNKFRTDLKYFFRAMYNIIFRKARSK